MTPLEPQPRSSPDPSASRWVAILQPGYLPWLGYFDLLDRVDQFVAYDHVKFTKQDWRTRNRILTANGPIWLSVPVKRKVDGQSATDMPISRVEINYEQDWAGKHLKTIRQTYAKAPFFDAYFEGIEAVYLTRPQRLADLDLALAAQIASSLGIDTPVVRSSSIATTRTGSEQVLEVCRHLRATDYYTGEAARDYLDEAAFEAAGVSVHWQTYAHPTYAQLHGEPFASHMCALDLLFNVGAEEGLALIRSGRAS